MSEKPPPVTREWDNLPPELLAIIGRGLCSSGLDLRRFGAVCKNWRSAAAQIQVPPQHLTLPLNEKMDIHFDDPILYAREAVWILSQSEIYLIETVDEQRNGWIIRVSKKSTESGLKYCLLHPFSAAGTVKLTYDCAHMLPKFINPVDYRVISLAKPFSFFVSNQFGRRYYLLEYELYWRAEALSSEERDGVGWLVFVIDDYGMLFYKKEEDEPSTWKMFEHSTKHVVDIAIHKKKLYAIEDDGSLTVFDYSFTVLNRLPPPNFAPHLRNGRALVRIYLIPCLGLGDLILVSVWSYDRQRKVEVKLYKLQEEEQSWKVVTSLGNHALFAGRHCRFSASFEGIQGLGHNCVYFLDDHTIARTRRQRQPQPQPAISHGFLHNNINVFCLCCGSGGRLIDFPHRANIFWPPPQWLGAN